MSRIIYDRDTGLFQVACIHETLNVYELSDHSLDGKRVIVERVYDGGGIIPHSELYCCGEVENVFHWVVKTQELGYYVLDRKAAMIRLGAKPAGPIWVKMHFMPTCEIKKYDGICWE